MRCHHTSHHFSSLQRNAKCSIHAGAKHIFWKLSKLTGLKRDNIWK